VGEVELGDEALRRHEAIALHDPVGEHAERRRLRRGERDGHPPLPRSVTRDRAARSSEIRSSGVPTTTANMARAPSITTKVCRPRRRRTSVTSEVGETHDWHPAGARPPDSSPPSRGSSTEDPPCRGGPGAAGTCLAARFQTPEVISAASFSLDAWPHPTTSGTQGGRHRFASATSSVRDQRSSLRKMWVRCVSTVRCET
jgi:hypothetical protein